MAKKNCVYECKQKVFTSESEERCSQECVNKIPPDGDINQFSKDCVRIALKKPKPDQIQTGSSGNSNSGSGNSSGNSNNNQAREPNPKAKDGCKEFDRCLAESNAGYLNNYQVAISGCGSCYRGVGACIQKHATCDCANMQYFILAEGFGDNAYKVKPDQAAAFKNCIEGR